ncbi:hypothetical protein BG011_004754 [Mortierella polycephala]|uniref:Uncharacterized protein n=1 Tax=Mortierella polycephala TaxID=41804 RepID=A0A9P6Q0N4_9FUNG|nr:hypothetical protein BG011_004754 [Mortierella polycephala]
MNAAGEDVEAVLDADVEADVEKRAGEDGEDAKEHRALGIAAAAAVASDDGAGAGAGEVVVVQVIVVVLALKHTLALAHMNVLQGSHTRVQGHSHRHEDSSPAWKRPTLHRNSTLGLEPSLLR